MSATRASLWGGAVLSFLLLGSAIVSVRNSIRPVGIVLHHSATSALEPELLSKIHKERGFRSFYWGQNYDIGYHYLIYPDGRVVATRPEHLVGAHATGYNSYIGICLIGNFSSRYNSDRRKGSQTPTQEQMRSLASLCRRLHARYGFSLDRIKLHKDLDFRTECPGDRFPFQALMNELK